MLSSVDLAGVASGNYIGAAAETVISQVYALTDRDMAIEERRALARHLDHLKRFPNDPRNGKILKEIEEIEKKKTTTLIRKQLDQSKQAAQKGDSDKALFYAEIASYFDPQSKTAQAELQKAIEVLPGNRWSDRIMGFPPKPRKPPRLSSSRMSKNCCARSA